MPFHINLEVFTVEEKLPEDGAAVLVFNPVEDRWMDATYGLNRICPFYSSGRPIQSVTHWCLEPPGVIGPIALPCDWQPPVIEKDDSYIAGPVHALVQKSSGTVAAEAVIEAFTQLGRIDELHKGCLAEERRQEVGKEALQTSRDKGFELWGRKPKLNKDFYRQSMWVRNLVTLILAKDFAGDAQMRLAALKELGKMGKKYHCPELVGLKLNPEEAL